MLKDCIIAEGTPDKTGYIRKGINNKIRYAHRLAYEKAFGQIPKGFHIHHNCGNKICINPYHLQAMTMKEHNKLHTHPRSLEVIAARTTCKLGHPLDGKNDRQRFCLTCKRKAGLEYNKRNRDSINTYKRRWRVKRKEQNVAWLGL